MGKAHLSPELQGLYSGIETPSQPEREDLHLDHETIREALEYLRGLGLLSTSSW